MNPFERATWWTVVSSLIAALVLLTPYLAAVAAPANHRLQGRCRGDTHAHVHIAWPTATDRSAPRHFGSHMPWRIRRWASLIVPTAHASGVDPYLVAAVMRTESNGDPLIWNLDSDARGLMQVLHAPFQPAVNLRLGVGILADLQHEFGRRDLVLAAYNAGPGAVQQYGGIPPYQETRDYVVIARYYRDLYAGAQLPPGRTRRFEAAWADLIASYKRICG